jgi:hypothetical protein
MCIQKLIWAQYKFRNIDFLYSIFWQYAHTVSMIKSSNIEMTFGRPLKKTGRGGVRFVILVNELHS